MGIPHATVSRTAVAAPPMVALLVSATLALAACGGSGSASATPSAVTPPSTAAPSLTATPTPAPTLAAAPWRPGSDTLAGTAAVARQWARILRSKAFKSAHVWAKEATFENWPEGWHLTGAEVRVMYLRAPASTDEWSHIGVLAKPGVAVLEEQFSPAPGTVLAALQLLAVGDSKIVHDEVFYDRSPGRAKPVKRWPAAPGPADTTTRTKKTTATFSRAMAASDVTTMQRLLARDMLFYDTTQKQGYRGSAQFAKWWKSLMPVSFDDMRTVPLIVGDGWAVARWTATGADASTSGTIMPGATVYEVRDGRIVRLTLYYDSATLPLQD